MTGKSPKKIALWLCYFSGGAKPKAFDE